MSRTNLLRTAPLVFFGLLLIVISLSGAVTFQMEADQVPITGTGLDSIDQEIIAFMERWNVPGGSYAVAKDGRLVMARGFGFVNVEEGIPAQPDDLYRIASVSKSITAVAILKLVDEGRLSVNERALEILNRFVSEDGPADQRILDITIDQLLHHTAGWDSSLAPDPMFNQLFIAREMGIPSPPVAEQIVRWLFDQPLQFAPGQRFSYHNVNYLILGRVIEEVTGQSYEDYVTSDVLAPMGIVRAQIGKSLLEDRATGEVVYYDSGGLVRSVFDDRGPQFVPVQYGGFGDIQPMDSHGGWITSPIDLLRFAINVDGISATPEFLSRESLEYMIADRGTGYGAGWFLNQGSWNHGGSLPGTSSILWITLTKQTAVAAILNMRRLDSAFFDDFVGTFLNAVDLVQSWPDNDLFDEYP